MMEMATKAKQLSDKQVYLVEDMQKDERIQQLSREVEALKRMLRDSLARQSSSTGEKHMEIVEFEEELSLVSVHPELRRVVRVRDVQPSNPRTANRARRSHDTDTAARPMGVPPAFRPVHPAEPTLTVSFPQSGVYQL